MKYQSIYLVSLIFIVFACGSEMGSAHKLKDLDLMKHGIPFTIQAPDSAMVETVDYGSVLKDVTIKKGDDFYVQIFASNSSSTDLSVLMAAQKEEVKAKRNFSKFVEEYDNGFIFENQKDSTNLYYGFRNLKLQGGKEFVIQNGLIGFFSKDAIKSMYEAVSVEKK